MILVPDIYKFCVVLIIILTFPLMIMDLNLEASKV